MAVKIVEGQTPVHVRWSDLLADFTRLLEHKRVDGAEAGVLSDFLGIHGRSFSRTRAETGALACVPGTNRTARRLRALLHEALGLEARIDNWGPCVTIDYLQGIVMHVLAALGQTLNPPEEAAIALVIDPADTITQARAVPEPTARQRSARPVETPPSGASELSLWTYEPGLCLYECDSRSRR